MLKKSVSRRRVQHAKSSDSKLEKGEKTIPLAASTSAYRYSTYVNDAIERRKEIRVMDGKEDVTPKWIEAEDSTPEFVKLHETVDTFLKANPKKDVSEEQLQRRTSLGGALRVSMDDIVNGISQALLILYETPALTKTETPATEGLREKEEKVSPFIKVYLRQTETILLFEQRSTTVLSGTEDAALVDKENKAYEYMTKGPGRLRRKADSEAQTACVLYKSRDVNTDTIKKLNNSAYVSNFDMFDTYQQLQTVKSIIKVDALRTMDLTTYKMDGSDPCDLIGCLPKFRLAQMITQRVLAGNIFYEQQRRFRNMFEPDPLAPEVEYLYRLQILWTLYPAEDNSEGRAVSCMSWCPSNGDILAVGYGMFTCPPNQSPKKGYVRVWSMKNPVHPEKMYEYDTAVVSVEFSPFTPQLLAIGLHDGRVEVRDIASEENATVAISYRETSPGYEPVMDIKWIVVDGGDIGNIEPFITVNQDASVMKYRVINSPYLLGFTHAILDRVEGSPEGLPVNRPSNTLEAVRHPQCLCISLDPIKNDIFYVVTNEGVIYKMSTNHPHQHLNLLQVHEGAAYSMEFSPWSPKVFLTCGDDWCVRIWIQGIFRPLVTLTNKLCPINCAIWSRTHSTVIVAISRRTVDIWDIRRSTLKPVSSTKLVKSNLTMGKFTNCGRSIAVGNEKGEVFMCALEDMPFSPHFQYAELEAAIFKALMPFPDQIAELKSLGYFGYPKKKKVSHV